MNTGSKTDGPRIALVATGLGRVFRGYEASVMELYRHVRDRGDFVLYAGGRDIDHGGRVLWNVHRNTPFFDRLPARFATFGRRYRVECLTFGVSLLRALRRDPVDVVFTPDHYLAEFLQRFGGLLPRRPKVIFSNGAPFPAAYCQRFPFVHQKSYVDHLDGVEHFPDGVRSYLIPNGFDGARLAMPDGFDRMAARRGLGLPENRHVVISLAALQTTHKRLDWLIGEFARLDPDRFYLLMAGAKTEETAAVEDLARASLPAGNYTIGTFPADRVPELLWAADMSVLTSLSEGFPRSVAEAMGAGRFILTHPHPNNVWILDNPACHVDMTASGALADRIAEYFEAPDRFDGDVRRNFTRFCDRFTWAAVTDRYLEMFEEVAKL